jgi:hypothetical protein
MHPNDVQNGIVGTAGLDVCNTRQAFRLPSSEGLERAHQGIFEVGRADLERVRRQMPGPVDLCSASAGCSFFRVATR